MSGRDTSPVALGTFRPISPQLLVSELAARLVAAAVPGSALRVAIDGADAAEPVALAERLVGPLRERSRPATVITARRFWRDASLRLEYGRNDVDSYLDWLDAAALRREVLDPLGPGGTGRYLRSLRDPETNRSTRDPAVSSRPGEIVLVAGTALLGSGLPFDVTIHLALGPAALARRTPPAEHWTLPALARYEATAAPMSSADVVVRVDDQLRPAVRN